MAQTIAIVLFVVGVGQALCASNSNFPVTGGGSSPSSNRSPFSSTVDFDSDDDDDLWGGGTSGSVTASTVNKILAWRNGIIPYEIGSDISDMDANALRRMFISLQNKTCVRFVPHRSEANYVVIQGGNKCSAPLGMKPATNPPPVLNSNSGFSNDRSSVNTRPGQSSSSSFSSSRQTTLPPAIASQVILGTGCFTTQRVARRIMNLLGIPHEASRPDRDQYVEINFNNLRSGYAAQLKKYPSSVYLTGVLDLPYDYQSVTEYSDSDIANDQKVWAIRPKNSRVLASQMGSNDFSAGDIRKIQRAYGCSSSGMSGR